MSALTSASAAETYLTRKEASTYLGRLGCPLSPRTLQRLGGQGTGPRFVRHLQRVIRYPVSALDRWAEKNRREGGDGE
jgi:hypothetical protein